jgi:hypothetical protein
MSTKCTETTAKGKPCKAWAVHDSNPPRCAAHGGGKPIGAPVGNDNARTHGLYSAPDRDLTSIADIIADLAEKQENLSNYIGKHLGEMQVDDLKSLLKIHASTASRLGRLLRDQRALSGEAADGISAAFALALDELATEFGIPL